MANIGLARMMTSAMSTVLGGFGVFCLLMSFSVPRLGGEAFILLGSATAMVCAAKR
jgi:hypothetical protein